MPDRLAPAPLARRSGRMLAAVAATALLAASAAGCEKDTAGGPTRGRRGQLSDQDRAAHGAGRARAVAGT